MTMYKHIDLILRQARANLGMIPRQFAETCGMQAEALRHDLQHQDGTLGLLSLIRTQPRIIAKAAARTFTQQG